MHVSQESEAATQARLLRVIAAAELTWFEGTYAFEEFPLDAFQQRARPDALAFVRDDAVWSQLVPCTDPGRELMGLFRFHFPPVLDNSGFVGWLATHLKRRLGTGVAVICGQNSDRGGIFDYWGCPAHVRDAMLREIEALRRGTDVRR